MGDVHCSHLGTLSISARDAAGPKFQQKQLCPNFLTLSHFCAEIPQEMLQVVPGVLLKNKICCEMEKILAPKVFDTKEC
jgi:hypothetical protein